MSRAVAKLVYSRKCGSMARKAVLACFAERASNDGSDIWASKQRIANEIECSKQTVITAVKALEADSIIFQTGKRKTQGGYTVVYAIDLAALGALEPAITDPDQSRTLTPSEAEPVKEIDPLTSQTAEPVKDVDPDQSSSLTQTVHEPSLVVEANASTPARPIKIPENWKPEALPPNVETLAEQWPDGRLVRELDGFRDYWLSRPKDNRRANWNRVWWNRIRDIHDRVMRDNRYANRPKNNPANDEIQNPYAAVAARRQAERAAAGAG